MSNEELNNDKDWYVPTPEEIEQGCKEIQATWDEETRLSRIADPSLRPSYTYHWEIPVVRLEDLGADLESALQDVVDIGEDLSEYSQNIVDPPDTPKKRIRPNIDRIKIV